MLIVHRAALAYDWRVRFGLSVSLITSRRIPWDEAWDLTAELLRDPDSHVLAAIHGDAYVAPAIERVMVDDLEVRLNLKRRKNQTPIRLERPWRRTPVPELAAIANRQPDPGSAERRAALAAHLAPR